MVVTIRALPLAVAIALAGCSGAPRPPAPTVYFVPIHAAPELMESLKRYYFEHLALKIQSLPPLQADTLSYASRHQLIAEELIQTRKDRYNDLQQPSVIIGVTSWDIHIRRRPWQFGFGGGTPYTIV